MRERPTASRLRVTATYLDRGLVGDLRNAGVKFDVKPREEQSLLVSMLMNWGPDAAADRRLGVLHAPDARRWQGRGLQLRQSPRPACWTRTTTFITFADVAGCDEAKKGRKSGRLLKRGVLMVGPPGTGKPCWPRPSPARPRCPSSDLGSDFVEMFVGVGAPVCATCSSRPRKRAPASSSSTKSTPSVAIAAPVLGGGNDEREQTLNQMLVEMDGFEANLGVIVIAATNRPDVLDPRCCARPF